MGMGKSLVADRSLQHAIETARADASAPIPVFVRASLLDKPLDQFIIEASHGLGNPSHQGAHVVIDGADEAGLGRPHALLAQARQLVVTWPNSKVIITSRPLPEIVDASEACQIPPLTRAEATALIQTVSGRWVTHHEVEQWPAVVHDLMATPLFAILIADQLARGEHVSHTSEADLIREMVTRTLRAIGPHEHTSEALLLRLAVLAIDRNHAPVDATEVGNLRDVDRLTATGLVVYARGHLAFAHAAFTEWFASESVAAGTPSMAELVQDRERLERWLFPISFLLARASHDMIAKLLSPLVEVAPGLAAVIVSDAADRSSGSTLDIHLTTTAIGQRLRNALATWIAGTEPLGAAIGPCDEAGTILPMGIRVEAGRLILAWHQPVHTIPPVFPLPESEAFGQLDPSEYHARESRPISSAPIWPWIWSLDHLTRKLKPVVERYALGVPAGPLAREYAWVTALARMGRGDHRREPMSISVLQERLNMPHFRDQDTITTQRRQLHLGPLRDELDRLQDAGQVELKYPWPGEDRRLPHARGGWIWSGYSNDQLLRLVRADYGAALEGYRDLVNTRFPRLAPDLNHFSQMPCRFIATLHPPQSGGIAGPSLSWFIVPNRNHRHNIFDIDLEHDADETVRWEGQQFHADEEITRFIPKFKGPLPLLCEDQAIQTKPLHELFRARPVTSIVFEWLYDDLSRLGWVDEKMASFMVEP